MTIAQSLLSELKHEAGVTRKMLERIPFDRLSWKPHEKSMSLLDLTEHLVGLPLWIDRTISPDDFDLLTISKDSSVHTSPADLIAEYDNNIKKAEAVLAVCDDEFSKTWSLRRGDIVFFTLPKAVAVRNLAMNHLVHHRGQLSVYLRLLDVPVPGAYGPSADDTL